MGSIVILPKNTSGTFGDLFQVKAEPNEFFISTAKVTDIELVDKISRNTLSPTSDSSKVLKDSDASADAGPYSINGYYPLYANQTNANNASPSGSSHTHTFYGTTFYMPNGLVMGQTMFHGNYVDGGETSSSSSSSSSSSGSSGGSASGSSSGGY